MGNRFADKLCRNYPMSEAAIAALVAATNNAKHVPAKRDLIREGDRPGPVFVILDGWACRY